MKIRPDQPFIQNTKSTETTPASSQKIQDTKTNFGIANKVDTFEIQKTNSGQLDPNNMVQYVLRESYLEGMGDLKDYADKVKFFNDQKKQVREYLQNIRDPASPEKINDALKLTDQLTPGGPNGNIMEILFSIFKESIQETNEDKKYYLAKLASLNKVSTSLGAQSEAIAEASRRLVTTEKKDDDDD
jgi:hypothetical protein